MSAAPLLEEESGTDLLAWLAADPALVAALEELARKEHQLEALQAQREAIALKQHIASMNATDGLGEIVRVMPSFSWHDIAAEQGTYDCFKDKSFNRYLDRKAPETRVKCVAPNSGNGLPLMVGWTPPNTPRFRKTYQTTNGHEAMNGSPSPVSSPPGEDASLSVHLIRETPCPSVVEKSPA